MFLAKFGWKFGSFFYFPPEMETQSKKKRNKRSGGVYEHDLVIEYENDPSIEDKKEKSSYNDLPTINPPQKNDNEPDYVGDTEVNNNTSELDKIAQAKISK